MNFVAVQFNKFHLDFLGHPVSAEATRCAYLIEYTKEIVRPLGSWREGGICADEGVVAKWSFVNIVERTHFLIS